jgi:hypothetical protein
MTIHTLHPHLANGKRPTVINPVLKKDAVAGALSSLDDHIRLLRCVADSFALDEEDLGQGQSDITVTLYFLHTKLRGECDKLYSLL